MSLLLLHRRTILSLLLWGSASSAPGGGCCHQRHPENFVKTAIATVQNKIQNTLRATHKNMIAGMTFCVPPTKSRCRFTHRNGSSPDVPRRRPRREVPRWSRRHPRSPASPSAKSLEVPRSPAMRSPTMSGPTMSLIRYGAPATTGWSRSPGFRSLPRS